MEQEVYIIDEYFGSDEYFESDEDYISKECTLCLREYFFFNLYIQLIPPH